MRMIELPTPKKPPPPPDLLRQIVVAPAPQEPQSRLILTIALLAVEDPTLLGPEDVQMLGKAMLEKTLGAAAF